MRLGFRRILPSAGLLLAIAGLVASPARAACGDGTLENGEQCDDGSANGSLNSCCDFSCHFNGNSPDVIVGDIPVTARWGSENGITAYSIATTSCNIGSCWLNFFANNPEHPVIAQNMFRLKDGRLEQLGQSWLKHGFGADATNVCSNLCIPSGTSARMGVNCSDTYTAPLNGSQSYMGPKSEVNPSTGMFPYPYEHGSGSGVIYKRLQVHNVDLDPALNLGALYFVESQYVSHDDAAAGAAYNNASYRRVTIGSAPNYFLTVKDTTRRGQAAIRAWSASDFTVSETGIVAGGGLFFLAAKATPLGGGVYHYEYAMQNINADRAAQSFSVPLPPGATVTNVGFHDVDYHSGELFDGTDWPATISPTSVTWATQTYAENPNANALRWGTLYNFRFDANVPPGWRPITLNLFKPGSPTWTAGSTVVPVACDVVEGSCSNGVDEDCDGQTDCADTDCCTNPACWGSDADHDHVAALCDCDDADPNRYPGKPESCNGIDDDCSGSLDPSELDPDGDGHRDCEPDCDAANPSVWTPPGEVRALMLSQAGLMTTLSWDSPASPGGTASRYDTLRSLVASDFTGGAECLEIDGLDTVSFDSDLPEEGVVVFYLVRCENDCPLGEGSLGLGPDLTPRAGRECP